MTTIACGFRERFTEWRRERDRLIEEEEGGADNTDGLYRSDDDARDLLEEIAREMGWTT